MSIPQPYPDYRSSGRDWLGDLPVHWELTPLKHMCRFSGGGTPSKETARYWTDGNIPWVSPKDMKSARIVDSLDHVTAEAVEESSTGFVAPGALLMVVRSGILQRTIPVAINDVRVTLNQDMKALAFRQRNGAEYFSYLVQGHTSALRTRWLKEGATVESVEHAYLANDLVPNLDAGEMAKIVAFLDYETARIDALIEKQRQLIALLKEKRQAVISHAVTKGLNPNAPLRDSGVEWLGMVPAHWNVHALRFCAKDGHKTFTDGDWIESPFITDSGVRLLQTGNVGIGEFREKGFRYISDESFNRLRCTEIFPNDVLVCRLDGPVGRACLTPSLGHRMVTSVDNTILKAGADFDPRFLVYTMTSTEWISWIENICRAGGGFRFRVSRSMLGSQRVPAPPVEDQRRIADFLDAGRARHDTLVNRAEEGIELLQERRIALISAAVTGKIDVRNWTPPESERERDVA